MRTAHQTIAKFEADVNKIVRKVFSKLVAQEFLGLGEVKLRGALRGVIGRPKVFDDAAIQKVERDYSRGLTQSELAKKYGVSQPMISRTIGTRRRKVETEQTTVPDLARFVGSCQAALEEFGSKRKAATAMGLADTTYRDRLKKELAS